MVLSALKYLKWQSSLFSFVRFFNITVSLRLSLPLYWLPEKHIKFDSISHKNLHSWDIRIADFSEWTSWKLLQNPKTNPQTSQLPKTSGLLLSETLFSMYSAWPADKHHKAIKFLHVVLYVYRQLHFWWGFKLIYSSALSYLLACLFHAYEIPPVTPWKNISSGCHHWYSFFGYNSPLGPK